MKWIITDKKTGEARNLPVKEKNNILDTLEKKYPNVEFDDIKVALDGEFMDVNFTYHTPKFERIRRITGYLVGTLDRFNDAKRHEVEDRVKHGINTNDDDVLNNIQ